MVLSSTLSRETSLWGAQTQPPGASHAEFVICDQPIDITYIPLARGFMYLVAILDWYSRRVLAWRVSNTLDTRFCLEALEEALQHYGAPQIFNTDQGCQFTSQAFTSCLEAAGVRISMDGRGCYHDKAYVAYCTSIVRSTVNGWAR